jgi:hypothetical protein
LLLAQSNRSSHGCGHFKRAQRAQLKQGIANGLTVDQAKQQLTSPEKYKAFAFQNFAVPNVEDMYKELKGTKQTQ